MTLPDWPTVFDEVHFGAEASDADVQRFCRSAFTPITDAERDAVLDGKDWPFDPYEWTLPGGSFPRSYLSLLRNLNGTECRNGDRWFQFFPINDASHGPRAMMLAYHVPQYMPFAFPFAFNGGGTFYLFDMRRPPVDDEYPIIVASAGALDFADSNIIAHTLIDACRGTSVVDAL